MQFKGITLHALALDITRYVGEDSACTAPSLRQHEKANKEHLNFQTGIKGMKPIAFKNLEESKN